MSFPSTDSAPVLGLESGPVAADGTRPTLGTFSPSAGGELLSPPVAPGYEVFEVLGRGGMGVVYRARQLSLNRPVALKVLVAGHQADAEALARFRAEAEAVGRLEHANIVRIYEVGQANGQPYLALELVAGSTLAHKLGGAPQPADEAARLVLALARAVHFAHRQGILHRDLKPGNVLMTPEGAPKIADFGLAKQLGESKGLTRTGEIMGTPSYVAPEQATETTKHFGPGVDVYALGAIRYEMLTGRPPFLAESPLETVDGPLMPWEQGRGNDSGKAPLSRKRRPSKCAARGLAITDPGNLATPRSNARRAAVGPAPAFCYHATIARKHRVGGPYAIHSRLGRRKRIIVFAVGEGGLGAWDVMALVTVPALVVLNGLFVAAEFALVSVRKTRIEELVAQGVQGARAVEAAMKGLDRSIAATQLGITLASIGLGSLGEPALARLLRPLFGFVPADWQRFTAHSAATILAFALITFLHVVFGELIPKSLAIQTSDKTALWLSRPLLVFAALTRPLILLMNGTGGLILRRLGYRPVSGEEMVHSVEELLLLIEDTEEAGILDAEQAELVENVFHLSGKFVRDCMVPREKMASMELCTPPEKVLEAVRTGAHTRMPIYEGEPNQIVGIVNTKDLFYLFSLQGVVVLQDALYPALFLKPDENIANALRLFRKARRPMALVRDEEGVILGLITLEDVLEEIVGDIEDEHDQPRPRLRRRFPGLPRGATDKPSANRPGGPGQRIPERFD